MSNADNGSGRAAAFTLLANCQLGSQVHCNGAGDVFNEITRCICACVLVVVDQKQASEQPVLYEMSCSESASVATANSMLNKVFDSFSGSLCSNFNTPLHPCAILKDVFFTATDAPRVLLFVIPSEDEAVGMKMNFETGSFTLLWTKVESEMLQEPVARQDPDVTVVLHPFHSGIRVDGRVYLNRSMIGRGAENPDGCDESDTVAVLADLALPQGAVYCNNAWVSPSTPLATFTLQHRLETKTEEDAEAALMRAAQAAFNPVGHADHLLLPGEVVVHTLDNVVHLVPGRGKTQGILLLTPYRLLFTSRDRSSYEDIEDDHTSLPIAAIFSVSKVGAGASMRFLEVSSNNFRIALFGFPRHRKSRRRVREHVVAASETPFAVNSVQCEQFPHVPFDITQEYTRIFGDSLGAQFRIVDNSDYHLCETYPSHIVAPCSIDEECLMGSAKFRSKQRLPAVTWRHPVTGATITRCSQPKSGIKRNRSEHDERLIGAVRKGATLYMIDSRPVASAKANQMIGMGHESADVYSGVKLHFIGIGNIHVMREAWSKLRALCRRQGDDLEDDTWLHQLQQTNWLLYIKQILAGASLICHIVDRKQQSVATHCSDGWDRSSQLCALAQLMLDAYYRTFEGFIVLIQKEFLAFGHKFASRHSAQDAEGTKAPIFLMFLDCVHQMVSQRQDAFEFNELFLKELVHHSYSKRFGTFLFDCERERRLHKVEETTPCLFAYLRSKKHLFCNPTYRRDPAVFYPETRVRYLRLWYQVYLGDSATALRRVAQLKQINYWKATSTNKKASGDFLLWGDLACFL